MRCIFVIAWVVVCLTAGPVSAAVIFSDDFNAGASAQWGNQVGNWAAAGGVYNAANPSNSPPTASLLPFDLTDFVIDVDVNDIDDGGVWLRATYDPVNSRVDRGVLLVTGGESMTGSGFYWHIVDNGNPGANLNAAPGLFINGESDVRLRITVTGDTYSVFLNGSSTAATSISTTRFASGTVGLYDFSNQTFDNFVLDSTAIPTPGAFTGAMMLLAGMGVMMRRGSRL